MSTSSDRMACSLMTGVSVFGRAGTMPNKRRTRSVWRSVWKKTRTMTWKNTRLVVVACIVCIVVLNPQTLVTAQGFQLTNNFDQSDWDEWDTLEADLRTDVVYSRIP